MLTRRIRPIPISRRLLLPSKQKLSCRFHRRQLSSSAPVASSQHPANASVLAAITTELDRIAPRIDIRADQIKVLQGPEQFYETLKSKIRGAKRRIYLSTLYIGKSEYELISALREALVRGGPELKMSILTDALRGTRESPDASCASLLAPLAAEFPDQVEIRMYHTPNLTGLRKRLIPKRINEGWGLQHIKLYGFDDEVILSGANLSNDYFTNRQDRYHVFSAKSVAKYFARIHHVVCSVSFLLLPSATDPSSYILEWPDSNPVPSPLVEPRVFVATTTALLLPLCSPPDNPPPPLSTSTTSVYPLMTHPPTINTELPALRALLSSPLQSYTFTAGYFNPHPLITTSLLLASRPPGDSPGTILTASPSANGFYNSAGISGLLPAAYTHLSLVFLRAARGANVQLREWQRGVVGQPGGWTYHAKGLWLTLSSSQASPSSPSSTPGTPPSPPPSHISSTRTTTTTTTTTSHHPAITSIGSSNYTTRSYGLDLEVGALVVTRDPALMAQWERERAALLHRSRPVTEDELGSEERRAGWRVRVAMWIVRVVGGAL